MKRQIIDTIEQYEKIVILRHVRPDPDAYGSQIGLKEIICENYPAKKVYVGGMHDPSLTYLAEPDQLDQSHYEDALVIVTDTGNTGRIDGEFYEEGKLLMKIDHHPNTDPYGDIKWVDTTASSTSEMIWSLFSYGKEMKNWTLSPNGARLLFAGIVGDTGRFMFPSTTEHTFEAVSDLIRYDFNRTELFTNMYELDEKILHLQGHIYQNFEMDEHGAAFMKVDRSMLEKYGLDPSETSQLVGILGNVKGICVWVIIIEEEHQIRVRLRSKGPSINGLAAEYGGGGHPLAAGASVKSWEEADELIEKMRKLCR